MKNLKKDFPFFAHNPDLVYCDSAATSHKPQVVIDRMTRFYAHENAPVYRGLYALAENATSAYETVRKQVRDFIGAQEAKEIIFTSNATTGINLVAHAWARHNLKAGEEILLTELEHHANLVPWLQIAQEIGVILRFIPVLPDGQLDYTKISELINPKTKLVAVTAISNVTGHEVDLELIQSHAHSVGAALLVDACQSAPRRKINVEAQNIDFLVFSGHKLLGPSGIGVLFARRKFHAHMRPFCGGGGAVTSVDFSQVTWRDVPDRYEVGTPALGNVLGLGAALTYLTTAVDFDLLKKHEAHLCELLLNGLHKFSNIQILGCPEQLKKTGHLVSFMMKDGENGIAGIHAHDIAVFLDTYGIAVRAGHHCAQPLHAKLGSKASVRVSFYLYNTPNDVQKILNAIEMLVKP